jgi:hypothetical protein
MVLDLSDMHNNSPSLEMVCNNLQDIHYYQMNLSAFWLEMVTVVVLAWVVVV